MVFGLTKLCKIPSKIVMLQEHHKIREKVGVAFVRKNMIILFFKIAWPCEK